MKTNTLIDPDLVRNEVRQTYGKIANGERNACCFTGRSAPGEQRSGAGAAQLGYVPEEIAALPDGAYLGLSCGNPHLFAALKAGETVLDLGSGAGFDCFLAARSVGRTGRVIGVDMTAEMLAKARANAVKVDALNVEFRLGEIEALPLADDSVDAIISNCVVNLSPDKPRVFREAFRVLKPGGRLAIADILRTAELPPEVSADLAAHCGCVAGAASASEVEAMLQEAGFVNIVFRTQENGVTHSLVRSWIPGTNAADYIVSATIEAVKPDGDCCGPKCCR